MLQTAWLVLGCVWRWNHVGAVCAGDHVDTAAVGLLPPYQWKSGRFMKVYIILLLACYSLIACCGTIGLLFALCGQTRLTEDD